MNPSFTMGGVQRYTPDFVEWAERRSLASNACGMALRVILLTPGSSIENDDVSSPCVVGEGDLK